ncbi:MAG TPA: VapC toxin family PIN domain ribonuclease [Cyanobacteria bacterium UBA11372]|nr:VapC toxin family PIN domain ribonuclease [Cyanobacteria bacterium UBA11372]
MYLLDSNACIRLLNKSASSNMARKLAELTPDDIRLCSVVKSELYYGAYKSTRRDRNLANLNRFFSQFISVPFDDNAAAIAGQVRAQLDVAGTPIGSNDLLIAAIALSNDLTLVTHNTREFGRINGLKYEDWE